MSKIERLNARVAKLLTVAVHEVLEVVKETVSEYQEKTARTQRENESLRRRLQEMQDKMKRENTAAKLATFPATGGHGSAAIEKPSEQGWSPSLRQDSPEPTQVDEKPALTFEQTVRLRQEEEEYNALELDQTAHYETECNFTLTLPGHHEGVAQQSDEAILVHMPQGVKNDSHSDLNSTSQGNTQLGINLTVIKTEPEPTECSAPETLTIPETFDCVDLSCNSTRYDPTTNAHKSHVSTGPYNELVFVHSSHNSVGRRFGFGKNSRDGRKHHRQHFRRDEPHSCFVCGKTFSRVGNLRIHQRCHTGEKPYCCLQCGRCFSQAGDLKKHKRVHTGEKPYYCGQCGKSFSRGENLKRHQKIHIGETLHLQQAWRDQQSN
ncbi:zinc finger protein 250 [Salvelinus namaycush]|uniref:Zinc finger protein 250 n=1 Tax=Salvelinus namaycush TaxID=8040 RepID=A0A8U0QRY1_SALNM|nr:zinc finger protein 250 [Salvelinus namaycush]XP_038847507.1 zinc finger protein 250 [Salvelinus namaycush]